MKGRVALWGAFLVAFLVIGWPYWRIPYAQLSLPGSVWGPGLVAVAVLAALPVVLAGTSAWASGLVVGASVPAAILARVAYDVAADPTSHNLWPIELVLAAGMGLLAGCVGALAGKALVFLLPGRDDD